MFLVQIATGSQTGQNSQASHPNDLPPTYEALFVNEGNACLVNVNVNVRHCAYDYIA